MGGSGDLTYIDVGGEMERKAAGIIAERTFRDKVDTDLTEGRKVQCFQNQGTFMAYPHTGGQGLVHPHSEGFLHPDPD